MKIWLRVVLQSSRLLGAVLVVGLLSTGGIVLLQRYSVDAFTDSQHMNKLGLEAQGLSGPAWLALSGIDNENFATADRNFSTDLADLDQRLSEFHIEATGGSSPPLSLRTYVERIEQVTALLHQGDAQNAYLLLDSATPLLYQMVSDIDAEGTRLAHVSDQRSTYTLVASVVLLIGAFLTTGVIFVCFRMATRNASIAQGEKEILRRSEARFRPLVESSADVIAVISDDVVSFISPSIEKFTGIKPEAFLGKPVGAQLPEAMRPAFMAFYEETKARPNHAAKTELAMDLGFATKHFEVVATNHLADPDVNGLVLNIRDITERKTLEEQLRHQAFHDALTGLANLSLFEERLTRALTRSGHQYCSVVYMDIDHLKTVNDELGHMIGNQVLCEVARRLVATIDASDTAARLSGDEFAILVEPPTSRLELRELAERIRMEISRPFLIEGHELHLSTSIGVVMAESEGMTSDEMLRNADLAMYDAKEDGRDRVRFYEPSMRLSTLERLRLTTDLKQAIDHGEIVAYYQPTMRLSDQRLLGFEALARWHHPEKGLLLPDDFIPLAEDSGVIQALGNLVLTEACRQAKEWQDAYPAMRDIKMAVNVSSKQVREGLVEVVEFALEASGLAPRCLVLEVTESVLISDHERAFDLLARVKRLGVSVALDDFGTGYSSLSYLKRFPIDILKIDRSFIDSIDQDERDKLLVQTIIDLGHTLNLEIVAEGIERDQQLSKLVALNCDFGQGYLFARPLDVTAAQALLEANERPATGIRHIGARAA